MADSFDHCEELVREGDKNRFLATLFAPAKYRRPLFVLYAFNVEIARIRELAREPLPGEVRLQWWRDVLAGGGHIAIAHKGLSGQTGFRSYMRLRIENGRLNF